MEARITYMPGLCISKKQFPVPAESEQEIVWAPELASMFRRRKGFHILAKNRGTTVPLTPIRS
jgi:hypothetical protein